MVSVGGEYIVDDLCGEREGFDNVVRTGSGDAEEMIVYESSVVGAKELLLRVWYNGVKVRGMR